MIAVQLLLNKSNKPLQDIHCRDFTMLYIVPKFLLFIDMSGFIKILIQHGSCDYPLQKWFNDFVIPCQVTCFLYQPSVIFSVFTEL